MSAGPRTRPRCCGTLGAMRDLFGAEVPEPAGPPAAPPFQPTLIDAAAERLALASGRPKSQERVEALGFRCACVCGYYRDPVKVCDATCPGWTRGGAPRGTLFS